jgi:Uma2 family endonuclease
MATAASAVPIRDRTFYIDSDGKPMGETPRHVLNFRYTLEPLDNRYAGDPNVFVAGNMFVHYVQGDGNRHVSPDIFVVFGVPSGTVLERRSYRTWEEGGKGPDVVIELTSKSTRREDTATKKALYQDVLKVKEYYLFDPYGEYLRPRLQGFRLFRRHYGPIRPVQDRLPSKLLQLHLEVDGELLRFYDPVMRCLLPIPPEIEAERQELAEARLAEAEARRQAEREVEHLRRELNEMKKRLPPS